MTKTELAFIEYRKVFETLGQDVDCAIKNIEKKDDDFSRRVFIKTFSSFLEGVIYQLRKVSLVASEDIPFEFTSEELFIMKEENYSLNKKGNIESKSNYQKLLPMLLFSTSCYARIHGIKYKIDTGNNGWEALNKYIEIRNQMMHPKSISDLEINTLKLKTTEKAFKWVFNLLSEVIEKCNKENIHYKNFINSD